MARWRLLRPHYLSTNDSTWEQKETNRDTGRQAIIHRKVPRYLDPENPADHTNRDGECIVCHEGKGQKGDIVFFGPPSNEMEPLDDEARKITEKERLKWVHPIEGLPDKMGVPISASMMPDQK